MFYKRRPLPATFMLASMLGLIITIVYTGSGRFDEWFAGNGNTWGFTFGLVFALMFFASLISLESNKVPKLKRTYAEIIEKPKKRKTTKKVSKPKKKATKKRKTVKKKVTKKKAVKKKVAKKKSSKRR